MGSAKSSGAVFIFLNWIFQMKNYFV